MGILEDYETYFNKYQKTYGSQTIVLMQNGMFFEMYGIDNELEKVGLVKEIASILNIQWTRRNKSVIENNRNNCLLAGFPCNSLDRYMTMLTDEHNYVVVVVEQVTPAPNPKRAVTNIVGPGTNIKYLARPNSSYLVAIYIESEGNKINTVKPISMLTVGLAAIDVSTGQTISYQVCNSLGDENHALDEAYRFIRTLDPKEIIINSRNFNKTAEEIIAYLDVNHLLVHCELNTVPTDYYKLSYQNEFLGKIFKTGMLKPIEYIDMERTSTALISYILLLTFCYNQNETLINQIDPPLIWNEVDNLILDNNCVNQLNLVGTGSGKLNSVFDLVNQTSTSMGRRLLKDMLLMPLIDINSINKRYECVDFLRKELIPTEMNAPDISKIKKIIGHQKHYKFQGYECYLKQIADIQRFHRKICLGVLQPSEFNQLHTSYQNISLLIKTIIHDNSDILNELLPKDVYNDLNDYIEHYQAILNLDETQKYHINDITGSFFNPGYNDEIDQIQDEINECTRFLKELSVAMSNHISPKSNDLVSYEYTETHGYYISVTAARFKTFLSKCNAPIVIKLPSATYQINPTSLDIFNKTNNGKNYKINCAEIKLISQKSIDANTLLTKKVLAVYYEFLNNLYETYSPLMKSLCKLVSHIDVYKSNAKTSLLYNYCRPEIQNDTVSRLKAIQIRHPLIERFQESCRYVPQDIDFGGAHRGLLLYGTNCSGKCYAPNTPILMHDGNIKKCSEIKIGDQLMGDDSKSRNVLSITKGIGKMYEIIPSKGDIIRVNGPHILVLRSAGYKNIVNCAEKIKNKIYQRYRVRWIDDKHDMKSKSFTYTENNKLEMYQLAESFKNDLPDYSNNIVEISVDDYMKKSTTWKINYYLYTVGVDFKEQKLNLDPYIMGHWLGDGTSSKPEITTSDTIIVDYNKYFSQFGLTCKSYAKYNYSYTTSQQLGSKDCNFFTMTLRQYNVLNNKHIPREYLINSRQNRLKLFAGLIDSDGNCSNGYGFDFVFKSKQLSDDLCYLARSLGYMAIMSETYKTCTNNGVVGKYWRIYISGIDFTEIPLLLEYKRPTKIHERNTLNRSFTINPIGIGSYAGFLLDGNQRHLLGDFTVGHNSSLMKAVGICTVMAQAGLYVPASNFIYSPYKTLLTRIIGNDNLFKGQSSFGVEMSELRGIIKRADHRSLVLGDEICHGTETISGVSIVAAAIITLSKLNSNFLFATHLHQLSQTERILNLANVKMCHLKVKYDEKTGELIYDRRLEDGPGHPIYGLEVARAMELDRNFIELANEIRKEVMEVTPFVALKKSKYNADIYINKCRIPECKNDAIDTHHIKFQSMADEKGFIDHLQKNHKSNLIPLCKECHKMVHCNQIDAWRYIINGYIMSSNGPILSYEKVKNTKDNMIDITILDQCNKDNDTSISNNETTVKENTKLIIIQENQKLPITKKKILLKKL